MQGFKLGELPPQLNPDLRATLAKCETATIGHFMHGSFIDRKIAPVQPIHRIAGTAVTLKIPAMDSTLLHHVISQLRPHDILVIDRCGDDRHACWGGVMTNAADHQQLAGVVIDGPVTDVGEIERLSFPVWCTGRSPITTKLLGIAGSFNQEVTVGGLSVKPGDAILADESGVIALPADEAGETAERAIAMQEAEIELLKRLRAGTPLGQISGARKLVLDAMSKI